MTSTNYNTFKTICLISLFLISKTGIAQNVEKWSEDTSPYFILDAHVHAGLKTTNGKITISGLNYFNDRKIDAFVFALPVDRSKTNNLLLRVSEEIELIHYLSNRNGALSIINKMDTLKFRPYEKTSILFSIEYFDGIFGNSIESIQSYKELGIHYITLFSNANDKLFTNNNTLTEFGTSIIQKMNEVNMLIDISHLSEAQMLEVIRHSRKPVIASHSAARAVSNAESCLSDIVLVALKRNGGYVMVTFNKADLFGLGESKSNGVEQLVRHINYLKQFIGISHIGIGSDYQAAGKYIPEELKRRDVFKNLINILKENGYSENETKGILAINFLNAFTRKKNKN